MDNFNANNKRTVKFIFLILFFGVIIGSIFSQLIAILIPEGVVKDFFLNTQY